MLTRCSVRGPDEPASSAMLFLEHQNLRQPDSAPLGQAIPSKGQQKDGTKAEFLAMKSCSGDWKEGGGIGRMDAGSTSENVSTAPA